MISFEESTSMTMDAITSNIKIMFGSYISIVIQVISKRALKTMILFLFFAKGVLDEINKIAMNWARFASNIIRRNSIIVRNIRHMLYTLRWRV